VGAAVTATASRVRSAFRTADIPLCDIATAELKTGWWWGTVRVRHASGKAVVSGHSRADATELATALEAARVHWCGRRSRRESRRCVRSTSAWRCSPSPDGTLLVASFANLSAIEIAGVSGAILRGTAFGSQFPNALAEGEMNRLVSSVSQTSAVASIDFLSHVAMVWGKVKP